MGRPRICVVSHAAYRALTGSESGHIGGVERQTAMLARYLVGRGYAVDFVTWREGDGDEAERNVEGIRLLPICRRDDGVPGVRFFHPRWTSLVAALRRSNADVYYHNTAEYVTGQVGLWCRRHGRRFVFCASSNADCDRALPCLPTRRERVLYRAGLRAASAVVVQTASQRDLMRSSFGVDAEVIPMPSAEPPAAAVLRAEDGPSSKRVLWVGRICVEKRPELLIETARLAHDIEFDLVGPIDGAEYGEKILSQVRRLANVTYHGAVPPSDMVDVYRRAACLLCTSHIEGFPNTFLEAWALGLPIVSTWDPDGVIARCGTGLPCGSSASAVVDALRSLVGSREAWAKASAQARAYYVATHRPEITFGSFERVLTGTERGHAEAGTEAVAVVPRS